MHRKPIAGGVAVPKKGWRQLMSPRAAPSSGPQAVPKPGAHSYGRIAAALPPADAPTITASEVEGHLAGGRVQALRDRRQVRADQTDAN